MHLLVSASLLIAGIIHLLPAIGVLNADRLYALYGIALEDDSLVLLLRHRAVLFGLPGAFFIYAAFAPACRTLALIAGLISVASFLLLAEPWARTDGTWPAAIQRVIQADIVALICLVTGGAAHMIQRSSA